MTFNFELRMSINFVSGVCELRKWDSKMLFYNLGILGIEEPEILIKELL